MSVSPDIAGFLQAARSLRQQFGVAITFNVPQAPTWPGGTSINPDTSEPYSPMVQRANAADTEVTIVAGVILKQASPLRPQADARFVEAGLMSGMDIILDVDAADYPSVQTASGFAYAGKNYRIEEWKPFQIAQSLYRWLCYGQER